MPYLSFLVNRPVSDATGERIGRLKDIIAARRPDFSHPEVRAIAVKSGEETLLIPFADVAVLIAPVIPLSRERSKLGAYVPGENDLFLVRDVLDQQLIDTNDVRVVRVNDIEIVRVNNHFFVANVDIGGLGLARRLGLTELVQRVASAFGKKVAPTVISWDDVELLPGKHRIRLKVPSEKIADLHPADLAEIISDLSRSEGNELLQSLDTTTVAHTLENVEPDFQVSLIQAMANERVADVLEEMGPDQVADLLAKLPEERGQEILKLMRRKEADDVKKLLAFPEDSAGGIMTTEFMSVPPQITADQVLSILRDKGREAETVYYIYAVDENNHLVGVFSLRDLVFAQPNTLVSELMHERVVSVNINDSQEEVAQIIAKYNLLATPVVDDEERLQGIVTADDALDKIIPTHWKKRLPRLYA